MKEDIIRYDLGLQSLEKLSTETRSLVGTIVPHPARNQDH